MESKPRKHITKHAFSDICFDHWRFAKKTCSSKLTLDVSKYFRGINCGMKVNRQMLSLDFSNWKQPDLHEETENKNFETLKIYISAINTKCKILLTTICCMRKIGPFYLKCTF